MLDLDFDQEQELLRQTARDVLARHSPLEVVRQMEDDPVGYPAALWTQLGELDLIGLLLPEEYGGSGMSLIEGVALYEELGRALAPTPHFVCGRAERWRPGRGRQRGPEGAVAAAGGLGRGHPDPGLARARERVLAAGRADDGGRPTATGSASTGSSATCCSPSSADRLVVLARTGDEAEAVDLFLVDPKASGVTLRQQFSIASDTQYEVTLSDVVVSEADRIGPAGSGWATWQEVLEPALVLLGAQAVGGARYALEITTQYAKDRHQFDKPLGAFQALAHYLADAVTNLDGAEQLVHEAAWAGATGRSLESLAPMAKLFACSTFRDITAMAQQLFGGIGFTLDFDIQLYFRRAKQQQLMWANDRVLEDAVAASLFD